MIIGVTGPIAAGTDSFMDVLSEKGFESLSYSEELRGVAREKGIELTRENLQNLADDLRNEKGPGAISEILLSRMEEGKNYVVGNIRNPGEVEVLRNNTEDFILVMVDAPVELRFQRALSRNRESEPQTFEDFVRQDEKDYGVGQPEHGQRHKDVFDMADFKIMNDAGLEELRAKVEQLLKDLEI